MQIIVNNAANGLNMASHDLTGGAFDGAMAFVVKWNLMQYWSKILDSYNAGKDIVFSCKFQIG